MVTFLGCPPRDWILKVTTPSVSELWCFGTIGAFHSFPALSRSQFSGCLGRYVNCFVFCNSRYFSKRTLSNAKHDDRLDLSGESKQLICDDFFPQVLAAGVEAQGRTFWTTKRLKDYERSQHWTSWCLVVLLYQFGTPNHCQAIWRRRLSRCASGRPPVLISDEARHGN